MSPRFRSGTARAVTIAVLVVDLLVAGVAARFVLAERRARYADAERSTENLARVLGENLHGTMRLIDLALGEAKGEIERQVARGTISDRELEETISRLHRQVPFLDGIRTANAAGRVEHGTGLPRGPSIDISDRDYFVRAKTEPEGESIISAPLVSRVTGKRSLVVARRTNRADGSFGGVVYAVVLLEQFGKLLASVDVGRDGTVALRDRDFALVARQPETSGGASTIGQKAVSPTLRALAEAGSEGATFVSVSPVDKLEKVNAYRRIAGGTFHLIVSSACDEFLADWRRNAFRTAAAVLLFALLSLLGAWFAVRTWSRETEMRFRALIDGAPIAVALTRGGRLLYANRELHRVFDLPAESAPGRPSVEHLPPEAATPLAERIERRLEGLPVDPTFEVALPRRDGGRLQASVTDGTVELAGGPAVLAFIQDITERKRADEERERLIGELKKALADVKTLSGLLPICAHCKKVRDDQGYWSRIETFLRERSGAEFTHGICPDCAGKYFPEPGGGESGPER